MLTDDDAALRDERLGGSAFLVDIKPGVGIHDLHGHVRNDGANAQEESGIAGDNLGVVISADVADLHVAVRIKRVGLLFSGEGAVAEHFGDLHAGHNAGHVAGLIHLGEGILEVIKAGKRGEVAGHGNEGHVRVFLSGQRHVALMAVGVGDDQVAALTHKVERAVVAGLIFGNLVLPNDAVGKTQLGGSLLNALHVGEGVALGLITEHHSANLQVGGQRDAGGHAQHSGEHQSNQLLHACFLLELNR